MPLLVPIFYTLYEEIVRFRDKRAKRREQWDVWKGEAPMSWYVAPAAAGASGHPAAIAS